MSNHTIKVSTPDGVWLIGTIDDLPFWAKICDEPSGFGIDGGRVIKLHLGGKRRGHELFAYERGWDARTPAHKALLQALLNFCEALPPQDVWRQTMRRTKTLAVSDKAGGKE